MVPYDAEWRGSFEHERERLATVLGSWLLRPIEHIGSTAVPDLVAKPIIDMLAVVRDIEAAAAARAPLHNVGWVPAPEPLDASERKLSFCFPSMALRTHHLHIVERESSAWRGWLAFRDYLRAHPDTARQYGELKTRLATQYGSHPNERDAYRAGKADWVRAVTAQAFSEDR
jgi:GrpB-like predicted nucleotidyltransferase (UPF0157 family)